MTLDIWTTSDAGSAMKPYENSLRDLTDEFRLGSYVGYELLEGGNTKTFTLRTSDGRYFLKASGDPDTFALYKQVETRLNAAGVRQARLYSGPNGAFISSGGYAVFEFLAGEALVEITDSQLESLMVYLARYNEALGHIPVPEAVTDLCDPWKKADSLDYLLTGFSDDIAGMALSATMRATIREALGFLGESRRRLDAAPKQLIHGDIGPGNVLYDDDEAVSIVDFTPCYGSELYALCHFFYWQFLYFNGFELDYDRIRRTLILYMNSRRRVRFDPDLFYALFMKAAAFRLFGPMISSMASPGSFSEETLERRACMLRLVMEDRVSRLSKGMALCY